MEKGQLQSVLREHTWPKFMIDSPKESKKKEKKGKKNTCFPQKPNKQEMIISQNWNDSDFLFFSFLSGIPIGRRIFLQFYNTATTKVLFALCESTLW